MTGRIIECFPQTQSINSKAIRLGLKARIFSGATPDKSKVEFWEGGEVPWIGSGEVNQGIVREPTAYITEEAVRQSATKLFPKGSVVMALAGQGKTKATVATMGIDAYGNQSLAYISDYQGNSRFLYWWLHSLYREIRGLSSQDTRDGLNQSMIGQIPVPDFSQTIQKAIAEFLDRETARIDQLIEKKQRLVELLGEKVSAEIDFMLLGRRASEPRKDVPGCKFTDSIPTEWQMLKLKSLCSHLGNGFVGPTRDILIDGDEPDAVPYLQSTHIKNRTIDFERRPYFVSRKWLGSKLKAQVRKDDLLIVQTGDCGATSIASAKFDGAGCHAMIVNGSTACQQH